jgi:hypothetical protein
MPVLPGWFAELIILTQIGAVIGVGLLAALSRRNKVRGWVLAVSAFSYGTTLYATSVVGVTGFRGYPSLFLLIFVVNILLWGLKEHSDV